MKKEPNTTFIDMNCRNCGEKVKPVTDGSINETHGYKLFCPNCKNFVGWGGKRKVLVDDNGKRQASSQWSAERLGKTACELCMRERHMLGPGTLEVHHKIPVSCGGEDEPDNILVVCTACHKQVHFLQCYFNRHLTQYFRGIGDE